MKYTHKLPRINFSSSYFTMSHNTSPDNESVYNTPPEDSSAQNTPPEDLFPVFQITNRRNQRAERRWKMGLPPVPSSEDDSSASYSSREGYVSDDSFN